MDTLVGLTSTPKTRYKFTYSNSNIYKEVDKSMSDILNTLLNTRDFSQGPIKEIIDGKHIFLEEYGYGDINGDEFIGERQELPTVALSSSQTLSSSRDSQSLNSTDLDLDGIVDLSGSLRSQRFYPHDTQDPASELERCFNIVTIDGDGNCYFRAIANFLARAKYRGDMRRLEEHATTEENNTFDTVRQQICDLMFHNLQVFQGFLVDADYINRMRQDGVYGGEEEIAATSNLYNLVIFVFDIRAGGSRWRIYRPDNFNQNTQAIYLVRDGPSEALKHYQLLIPNGSCQMNDHMNYDISNPASIRDDYVNSVSIATHLSAASLPAPTAAPAAAQKSEKKQRKSYVSAATSGSQHQPEIQRQQASFAASSAPQKASSAQQKASSVAQESIKKRKTNELSSVSAASSSSRSRSRPLSSLPSPATAAATSSSSRSGPLSSLPSAAAAPAAATSSSSSSRSGPLSAASSSFSKESINPLIKKYHEEREEQEAAASVLVEILGRRAKSPDDIYQHMSKVPNTTALDLIVLYRERALLMIDFGYVKGMINYLLLFKQIKSDVFYRLDQTSKYYVNITILALENALKAKQEPERKFVRAAASSSRPVVHQESQETREAQAQAQAQEQEQEQAQEQAQEQTTKTSSKRRRVEKISKVLKSPKTSKALESPKTSKALESPKTSKALKSPKTSKALKSPLSSADASSSTSIEDIQGSLEKEIEDAISTSDYKKMIQIRNRLIKLDEQKIEKHQERLYEPIIKNLQEKLSAFLEYETKIRARKRRVLDDDREEAFYILNKYKLNEPYRKQLPESYSDIAASKIPELRDRSNPEISKQYDTMTAQEQQQQQQIDESLSKPIVYSDVLYPEIHQEEFSPSPKKEKLVAELQKKEKTLGRTEQFYSMEKKVEDVFNQPYFDFEKKKAQFLRSPSLSAVQMSSLSTDDTQLAQELLSPITDNEAIRIEYYIDEAFAAQKSGDVDRIRAVLELFQRIKHHLYDRLDEKYRKSVDDTIAALEAALHPQKAKRGGYQYNTSSYFNHCF
jgi:hypothetical protein